MSQKYIGCDLGGTNLRAGIVDFESERVSCLLSTPTLAREGHEAVMARMGALIDDVIAADGVLRITCITAAMYTVNGRKGTFFGHGHLYLRTSAGVNTDFFCIFILIRVPFSRF